MLKITHIHSRNIYQGIHLYGPLIKLKIITVSLVKFLSFLATQEGWKVEVRQGNQSLEIHPQKKKKNSLQMFLKSCLFHFSLGQQRERKIMVNIYRPMKKEVEKKKVCVRGGWESIK